MGTKDNTYANTGKRLYFLSDDVDNESIGQLTWNILHQLAEDDEKDKKEKDYKREPIKIYINSYGGEVYDMWGLIDIIVNSKTPIYTYCTGYAMSAAFNIFLGRSEIVGKPLVNMLIDKGATVISCNSKTQKYHMENFMKMSDIVISAIGKPKKFDSSYFGIDTIIIDVGINRDENGKLCGDIDQKDVEDYFGNCCYVTPVPGGVGLLTRVTLLKNVMK